MSALELVRRSPRLARGVAIASNRGVLPLPSREVDTRFADGRRMRLIWSDRTQRQMILNTYEPRETELIRSLLRPGDVFVDVGAHAGWFTIHASSAVSPGGRVFAFEALPPNAARLRANLALSNVGNVTVVHAAVSDGPGRATVGFQPGSDSGSGTAGGRAVGKAFEVEQVSLDSALGADIAPRLVKIDVEGFEYLVLRGATRTLGNTHAVLVEINDSALASSNHSRADLSEMLSDAGLIYQEVLSPVKRPFRSTVVPNLFASRER